MTVVVKPELHRARTSFAVLWLVILFCTSSSSQEPLKFSGVILDTSGAPIPNATIELRSNNDTTWGTSDSEGKFTLLSPDATPLVVVSSPGFMSVSLKLTPEMVNETIRVRLDPSPLIERLEISSTEVRIPPTPTSQYSISRHELEASGALTIDDVLRQVPGFSLFRRSGSLVANPTSQGVSLRGVGASGASRALVLLDGIPLNNAFGGWVYWTRISRTNVERLDTYNGATSDLYGSGALGGVINLKSRSLDQTFLDVETSLGNRATPSLSLDAGRQFGGWGLAGSFLALRTDGYILVSDSQRGTVDTPAGTSDLAGSISLSKKLSHEGRAFLRLNLFGESRRNGTPLQINDTRGWSIDSGSDWTLNRAGDFSIRVYGSSDNFNQNFSAVAADRNSESLTNRQHNPSQQLGWAFQWRSIALRQQVITAGIEGRDVRGHSAEATFAASRLTANLDAGGRQRVLGFFAQDNLTARSWILTFGARFDRWVNIDGFANRIPVAGSTSLNSFPDRSETAFSPRLSIWRQFENGISLGGSVYHSFRAPTLNELYRGFRVGNVVTNANPDLRAESLTGGEVGISIQKFSDRLTLRGNLFTNTIDDPVANVTLSNTAALITRQRQNLGAIQAQGVELSGTVRLTKQVQVSSEYLLTASKVTEFPPNQILVGLMVPQVPRNQVNFQVTYFDRSWTAGVQGRFVGKQFDDDLNAFPLKSFFTVDAEVTRAISAKVRLFVAVQNLNGVRYEVSKTPVVTIGPPVLIRIGGRISYR